jgi:hypothetical protein
MKLMNQVRKFGPKIAVPVAALLAPMLSFAQAATNTYDATQNVAAVMATIAGLLALGGAVFLVHLAIKSTKWARKAT